MTEKTQKKQRGRPFPPGKSGNPSGRPAGARNVTTLAMEALLDGEANAITRKAVDLALAGDQTMIRLCMDRLLPPRKDRPVSFALPSIESPADATATMTAVLTAVSTGEITPSEAGDIAKLVDSFVRAAEAADLAARIERLEKATAA
jgi:hypothetical protein